jgi:hypothetical protein
VAAVGTMVRAHIYGTHPPFDGGLSADWNLPNWETNYTPKKKSLLSAFHIFNETSTCQTSARNF